MLGLIRSIALFVIGAIVFIFLIQNLATTEAAFLTWSFTAPRAIVFVLLFALGAAFGYLLRAIQAHRKTPAPEKPAAP